MGIENGSRRYDIISTVLPSAGESLPPVLSVPEIRSMKAFTLKNLFFAILAGFCLVGLPVAAQSDPQKSEQSSGGGRPMFQNIQVQRDTSTDANSQLVKKTGSSTIRTDTGAPSTPPLNAVKTSFPILAATAIP